MICSILFQANAARISGLTSRAQLEIRYGKLSSAWRRDQLLEDPATHSLQINGSVAYHAQRNERLAANLRDVLASRARAPLPDASQSISSRRLDAGTVAEALPAYKLTRRFGKASDERIGRIP